MLAVCQGFCIGLAIGLCVGMAVFTSGSYKTDKNWTQESPDRPVNFFKKMEK